MQISITNPVLSALLLGTLTHASPLILAKNANLVNFETTTIECPSGQFIKQYKWSESEEMKTGIEIYCHVPRSQVPQTVLRSHGSGNLTDSSSCVGFWEFWTHSLNRPDEGPLVSFEPVCHVGKARASSWSNKQSCGDGFAYSGLEVGWDTDTGAVYRLEGICRAVGEIETTCRPGDFNSLLFVCDAGSALYPLKCSRPKTVGYGSLSFSQEDIIERSFYEEFGFEMGLAGNGLRINFYGNLPRGSTGYSWGENQEDTFSEEVTITVEVEAPPGCITQAWEVLGYCAFMRIKPNYLQRLDNCKNVTFITNEVIPENISRNGVYVSKIPEKVLKHLESLKDSKPSNFV